MDNTAFNPLEHVQQSHVAKDYPVHLRVAEQGKMHALANEFGMALSYYRKAMELSVQAEDSSPYLQHYTLCMLESLEQKGDHEAVLQYCNHALETYQKQGKAPSAALLVRKALQLLKIEDYSNAKRLLEDALPLAATSGENLLLTQAVLSLLETGKKPLVKEITELQQQHHYFSVRNDTVQPDIALRLPASAFS